ncbi:MAG: hypothetical protein GX410_10615 [Elusimicrobia bacterium]|nr:hypothetical protein [Elusimicrobiota bacterium]
MVLSAAGVLLPAEVYAGSPQAWVDALFLEYAQADNMCTGTTGGVGTNVSALTSCNGGAYTDMRQCAGRIHYDKPQSYSGAYPGGCLKLCATVKCLNNYIPLPEDYPAGASFEINSLTYQVFAYDSDAVPWNDTTAPAIQIAEKDNIGVCPHQNDSTPQTVGTFCIGWNGFYNVDSEFGKLNGQYGFRTQLHVAQASAELGSFEFTDNEYYPNIYQHPIVVDVVNLHSSSATPTLVGSSSQVASLPYKLRYRISKDALVSIAIKNTGGTTIRQLLTNAARVGDASGMSNTDTWDGRNDDGTMQAAGNYVVQIDAHGENDWGLDDVAAPAILEISADPLQMTDFAVSSLQGGTTEVATISYVLTQAATVYTMIYPPGTTITTDTVPPTASNSPVRTIVQAQSGWPTIGATYWDGRDNNSVVLEDGDYVYAIYAQMPGGSGTIRTRKNYIGTVALARGLVGTSQLSVGMGVLGSSPAITALRPYSFSYQLARDAYVEFNILTSTSGFQKVVRHLVRGEPRSGGATQFVNREYWDGNNDDGYPVAPGTYQAEMKAWDPLFYLKDGSNSSKFSRVTTTFPVDMFRMTNVDSSPLRYDTTDQQTAYAYILYTPSETMYDTIKIYRPGTVVNVNTWPPVMDETALVHTIQGVKAGKTTYAEPWNGYENDTTVLPDGLYVFTITAKPTAQVAIYDRATSPYYTLSSNVYASDRSYGYVEITRGPVYISNLEFNPSSATAVSGETVEIPPYEVSFAVTRISSVTITIQSSQWCGSYPYQNNICRTLVAGRIYDSGETNIESWDGKDDFGNYLYAGAYTLVVNAYDYPDPTLQVASTLQMAVDIMPFQVFGMTVADVYATTEAVIPAQFQYQLSVPMKVAIQIFKPGTIIDVNGNPNPPISSGSLVKALISIDPAGIPITLGWDGTDQSGAMVPDGHYVFRVVNSTDSKLVDSITGEIANGNKNYVADYRLYSVGNVVTVTLGTPANSQGAFEETASFYPNPLRAASGKFRITRLPFSGNYSVKIFNLAGDLVRTQDFGYLESGTNPSAYFDYEWEWDKTNEAGRRVARGLYFGLLEGYNVRGGANRVQKVIKILIP